jgi:hypothetical protein
MPDVQDAGSTMAHLGELGRCEQAPRRKRLEALALAALAAGRTICAVWALPWRRTCEVTCDCVVLLCCMAMLAGGIVHSK